METKEAQENINKILEEEKPEKLLPKFEKAEEACYKGSEQGLKNLVYFASEIVWYYWDKKQMDSVVEIYVKVRKVIDYLIGIKDSFIWQEALVSTYPKLANVYMELGEWEEADSTIQYYLKYLHEMCNGVNILNDLYCHKCELENLFHTVERLSNHYKSVGETYQALTCLSSISRFMNFSDEKTQVYYDASLAKLFYAAFLESYNNAKENFDCLKAEGPGTITEDMKKIMSELHELQQ